jgi:hypothetical protein
MKESENDVGRVCDTYGVEDKCIQILVGKPKELRLL